MVHRWKESGEISGPDKRSENALRKAIELSGVNRLELWPDGGKHEQSIAVRVDGTREVRWNHGHELDGVDGWVTGTDDFQWWIWDGELWIDDLKTGKYYPNPPANDQRHDPSVGEGDNRFPQDPASSQLKLYGLGMASLLGYDGCVNLSVTHWPRLPLVYRHAPPTREWSRQPFGELMEFWGQLEQLYLDKRQNDAVLSGFKDDLRLNPGDQCRFCPARDNCLMAQTY